MAELSPSRLAAFVRAVAVLASPASTQVAWLETLGPVASWNVDELGLEFDDGFVMLPQWIEAGCLTEPASEAIGQLNEALDAISGQEHEALWTREALHTAPEWEAIPQVAWLALASFK